MIQMERAKGMLSSIQSKYEEAQKQANSLLVRMKNIQRLQCMNFSSLK